MSSSGFWIYLVRGPFIIFGTYFAYLPRVGRSSIGRNGTLVFFKFPVPGLPGSLVATDGFMAKPSSWIAATQAFRATCRPVMSRQNCGFPLGFLKPRKTFGAFCPGMLGLNHFLPATVMGFPY